MIALAGFIKARRRICGATLHRARRWHNETSHSNCQRVRPFDKK
jgi:hypothetical protein